MAQPRQTDKIRALRRLSLQLLAGLYLFPQADRAIAGALRKRFPDMDAKSVRDCLSYLAKKGYVSITRLGDGALSAQITPAGIDIVDGAMEDDGVLPGRADLSALTAKKSIRQALLNYCRQFPESFNGDDEMGMTLADQGMERVLIDQVRFHIWYLSGKGFLDLRSQPVNGDVVYLARITALGMDVADGIAADPGVTGHE
ncbi:MAG: hypothetical protein HY751_02980 [Nitrospinae bacterium]|nr:hypothetical protein [Nitrospinota bacterium]